MVLSEERIKTAWFQAGKERVEASVTQVDRHVVIRPVKPLTVGQTYTLGGTGEYRFAKGPWQWVNNAQTPLKWTVKAEPNAAPTWTGDIRVGKSSGRHGAWGPTSSQILHLSFNSKSAVLAEVRLTRGATKRTLLLPVKPNTPLRFGQGLCSGEIQLIGEGDWTASVSLIGRDGQRSEAKVVTFPSPKPAGVPRPQ